MARSNLFNLKVVVKHILEEVPEARDSDFLLDWKVWEAMSGNSLLFLDKSLYIKGRYADPISIRRVRQQLQQFHPVLRGLSYAQRHRYARQVKEDINDEKWKEIIEINKERKTRKEIDIINAEITELLQDTFLED